jgi:hypothetical protein
MGSGYKETRWKNRLASEAFWRMVCLFWRMH